MSERTTRQQLESAFAFYLKHLRERGVDTSNWRLSKEYRGWEIHLVLETGGEHPLVQGHIWKTTELWNALRFATDTLREIPIAREQ